MSQKLRKAGSYKRSFISKSFISLRLVKAQIQGSIDLTI